MSFHLPLTHDGCLEGRGGGGAKGAKGDGGECRVEAVAASGSMWMERNRTSKILGAIIHARLAKI